MTTRSLREWWRTHSAWVAVIIFGVSCVGAGYCIGTVQTRAVWTAEAAERSAAYREALATKDRLIAALASTTIKATGQAANAVETAAKAATVASDQLKAANAEATKAKESERKNRKGDAQ